MIRLFKVGTELEDRHQIMKNKIKTRKSTADAVKMLLEQYGQGWCIIVLVNNCCNLEGNYSGRRKRTEKEKEENILD